MIKHNFHIILILILGAAYYQAVAWYWAKCDLGGHMAGFSLMVYTVGFMCAAWIVWKGATYLIRSSNLKKFVILVIPLICIVFFVYEINSHKNYPSPFCENNYPFGKIYKGDGSGDYTYWYQ